MEIFVDDNLSGVERKKHLRVAPVEYALKKFNGNRTASAKWLGISIRTMRNILRKEESLANFRVCEINYKKLNAQVDRLLPTDKQYAFYSALEELKSRPGWRYADEARKEFLFGQLLLKYLKKREELLPYYSTQIF